MRQSSETLSGRVAYLDIPPLNTAELTPAGIADNTHWLRGGFPDSLLSPDDRQSLDWRRDLIRSFLERDVPMFAPRLPAETIGRLWTMLAHNQGGVLNQARIASALGVANPALPSRSSARRRPAPSAALRWLVTTCKLRSATWFTPAPSVFLCATVRRRWAYPSWCCCRRKRPRRRRCAASSRSTGCWFLACR